MVARRDGPSERVAAIDCGTNSARLLVVDGDGSILERLMQITRLGAGVDATGRLAPEWIERSLAVLREFRQVMDKFSVVRGRLVATSAARDASNGAEFWRLPGRPRASSLSCSPGPRRDSCQWPGRSPTSDTRKDRS